MSKNVGWVRLLEPDMQTVRGGRVLVLKQSGTYLLCPLWRSAPNKLVGIMLDKDGKHYIDASDPFAYELPSSITLEQRIDEFNQMYADKEMDIAIVKIATEDDLNRAHIPCYCKEDEPTIEQLTKIPCIRMFV